MSWVLDRLYFGKWKKGISGVRNNIHKDKKGKGEKTILCAQERVPWREGFG